MAMAQNFEIKGNTFKKGWYTLEDFNGVMTYWLVYPDRDEYTDRINNSGLILKLFKQLPEGAVINSHIKYLK